MNIDLKRGRVSYITFSELQDDYVMYGFPEVTVKACKDNPYNFRSDPYIQEDLYFIVLDLLDFHNIYGDKNRLAIYIRKDLCLFVGVNDENERIKQLFLQVQEYYEKMNKGADQRVPELFLYHFLDNLIRHDRKFLENMEFHMSILETRVLKERLDSIFINEILSIKKELMYIRNYYEQLIDVGEVLQNNETGLLPEESARLYSIFLQKVKRLCETVVHLKEYSVQLRETHDAMLDYNLNNIMKLFTVITTIFLPLTLIVGWYGMNFQYMPELNWRYGYYAIIMISICIVGVCIVIFRKYKLI
ncbi:MAG: CorA family divalent cation transporter [Lachnospiraceae bacterium]